MKLVVDTGPFIAIFSRTDSQHENCYRGYKQIVAEGGDLYTPFPIFCEIHKLLLQRLGDRVARTQLIALEEAVSVVPFDLMEIQDAMELVRSTPQWQGTLQDASIVVLTRALNCPVWTLDYRDLARFSDLEFWTPATGKDD
jgi:predicted nucleic acid-binding protein